jgi:ankyrin repeat protein
MDQLVGPTIDQFKKYGKLVYSIINIRKLGTLKKYLIMYPNVVDYIYNNSTPLMSACNWYSDNSVEIIKLLINYGANLNLPGGNGTTPLMVFCDCSANYSGSMYGNKLINIFGNKIIKLLIENGANLDSQNIYGNTALMLTSMYDLIPSIQLIEIIRILAISGAYIDPNTTKYRSYSMDPRVAVILQEYGAINWNRKMISGFI